MRRCLPIWTWLLCVTAGGACLAQEKQPPFHVDPAEPAWVESLPIPDAPRELPRDSSAGLLYLLIDRQLRVDGGQQESYRRIVKKVLSVAGVQQASEIVIEIDPSYEHLVIHAIRLHRGAETIDLLPRLELRVVQREKDLERRLYDGRVSVLAFLEDVRPGDAIEYGFTLQGANPVFGGHFMGRFLLARSLPVVRLRYRLLWPRERKLQILDHRSEVRPVIARRDRFLDHRWEVRDRPALDEDDDLPSWYDPYPGVYLTDFDGWAQVARWAAPLYTTPEALPADMQELVDRWKEAHPDGRDQLVAALRFVQDGVRYLGIEPGPHGYAPQDPVLVFRRRFGDCKDKSRLLIALLRRLGIRADAALANPVRRHALDEAQPTPLAFNHVIVRAELAGETLWLDPTISHQRGSFARLRPPPYRRALVIREDSRGLVEIPLAVPQEPQILVREVFDATAFDAPAKLSVVTEYRGREADAVRASIDSESRASIEKRYLNYYAISDPGTVLQKPIEFADDERQNVLRVEEAYRIEGFWDGETREVVAWLIRQHVHRPSVVKRAMPLWLDHPTFISQVVVIELPHDFGYRDLTETLTDERVRLWHRLVSDRHVLTLEYRYQILADHVPAKSTQEHLALLEDIDSWTYYKVEDQGFRFPWAWLLWILGTCAAISIVTSYAYYRTQKLGVVTGRQGMLGEIGTVHAPVSRTGGKVFVRGEYWNATTDGEAELPAGARVEVVECSGLAVKVRLAGSGQAGDLPAA